MDQKEGQKLGEMDRVKEKRGYGTVEPGNTNTFPHSMSF